jgi:hypothetical protein
MNRTIFSLAPLILAAGMLAVVFALLTAFAPAPALVQAGDDNFRCDFRSITVTAAGLGVTPGISDTLPGSSENRVVYFANHQTGTITLTVVLTDLHPRNPCYLWAAPAWGIPSIREYTATQEAKTVVITYSVAPHPTSATVVLTSSQYITGSLVANLFQEKILTFTRDVTGPVVSNRSITTTAPHLWPVGTTLYYTQASGTGESFQIKGSSSEPSGEAGLWKTTFVEANLGCGPSQPGASENRDWWATYSLCNLPDPGVLTATSYDYVGNFTPVTFAYQIDGEPPSSTVTTTVQVSYGKAPIPLRWSAEDSGSGVKEVNIYERSGPSWVLTYTTASLSGTFFFVPPTVDLTGPITYEFASAAVDHLGNTESLPSEADARVVVHPVRLYLPLVVRNYPPPWTRGGGTSGEFRAPFGCGTNIWYAGTWDNGVWKSENNAQTWSRILYETRNPYPVVADPSNCNQAFVSVWGAGIYEISSGQWVNTGLGELKVYALAITGTTLYAGTDTQGVYRTDISSIRWQAVNNGISDKRIRSLVVFGNEVYAGARGCKVYVSQNAGDNWSEMTVLEGSACGDAQVWSIAKVKNTLYAGLGLQKGLYARTDSSWQPVITGRTIYGLAYDARNDVLFVSAYGAGVYRCPVDSNGRVTTCIPHNAGLATLNTREIAIHGDIAVMGSDDGIWYVPLFR